MTGVDQCGGTTSGYKTFPRIDCKKRITKQDTAPGHLNKIIGIPGTFVVPVPIKAAPNGPTFS